MELTENETRYIRSLVRMDHTRMMRRQTAIVRKWGDEGDLSRSDAKIALIETLYDKIHPNGEPSWRQTA